METGDRGRMVTKRKQLYGKVVSQKMEKTIVVTVEWTVQHPTYGKVMRQRTKIKAHDEKKECLVGDKVRLVECRPLSKEKHWRVVEIVSRSKMVEPVADEGVS
jgi:small subunit ribosomal protein S17